MGSDNSSNGICLGAAEECEGNSSAQGAVLHLGQAHEVGVELLVLHLRDLIMGCLQPISSSQRLDRADLKYGGLLCARWQHQSASNQYAVALWPRADFDGVVYAAPQPCVGAHILRRLVWRCPVWW